TEAQHAAIVIAAELLIRISLVSAQLDQVSIEDQSRRVGIPDVPVDAIAKRRHFRNVGRIYSGAALSPVQIDVTVESEIRMQRQTHPAALGSAVHGQIERRCALDNAVRDALNLAGVLLKDEEVVVADKSHAGRLRE